MVQLLGENYVDMMVHAFTCLDVWMGMVAAHVVMLYKHSISLRYNTVCCRSSAILVTRNMMLYIHVLPSSMIYSYIHDDNKAI